MLLSVKNSSGLRHTNKRPIYGFDLVSRA
jgi:hypothetical protein